MRANHEARLAGERAIHQAQFDAMKQLTGTGGAVCKGTTPSVEQ